MPIAKNFVPDPNAVKPARRLANGVGYGRIEATLADLTTSVGYSYGARQTQVIGGVKHLGKKMRYKIP
jgi:hypothetical protein